MYAHVFGYPTTRCSLRNCSASSIRKTCSVTQGIGGEWGSNASSFLVSTTPLWSLIVLWSGLGLKELSKGEVSRYLAAIQENQCQDLKDQEIENDAGDQN